MKGAPLRKHEEIDLIDVTVKAVDRKGREMDERWGVGRLPSLVSIDMAMKFRSQQRKFSKAVWDYDLAEVTKHGEAMLRAYAKLDELAAQAGGEPLPVNQWEFETPDGLIVLVRDLADVGRVILDGRQAAVWSIDEIASVIRVHPDIVAIKNAFPGAAVESVRPPLAVKDKLNDTLMDLPF